MFYSVTPVCIIVKKSLNKYINTYIYIIYYIEFIKQQEQSEKTLPKLWKI